MQQNVVLGISMGGLVARYALRDMEVNGITHDTRLNISLDSPHQGANIPVGFQAMVSHLSGMGIAQGFPALVTWEVINLSQLGLGAPIRMLNSPAARQMLKYQVSGVGSTISHNNSQHVAFMNEYSSLGYPQNGGIRNLVLANGSECGTNQGYGPYAEFININQSLHEPLKWWGNILVAMGSPFFLGTNYPQLGIFGPLSTSSNVKAKFIVNTLPNQTTQRIYYGELYVRKKILGIINKNVTLFAKSFNSQSSYLPIDNAPGGVNDFAAQLANLPNEFRFNMTHFSFIPTYSALDIGGGTQSINLTDLNSAYSPAFPPSAPKNVRAHNFFTNPTEGGFSNTPHTSITIRNGRWLMQELEQGPSFFSCASSCGAFLPTLSGPASICSGTGTITATNVPNAFTISWTRSANLNYVSGQGTTGYVVSANGTGAAWVEASITNLCGVATTVRHNFQIGGITGHTITGQNAVCPNNLYTYTAVIPGGGQSGYTYNWSLPSGATPHGTTTASQITVSYSSSFGGGILGYTVNNGCGTSSMASLTVYQTMCQSMSSMNVYPNPAENQVFVEAAEETGEVTVRDADQKTIQTIVVLDNNGNEIDRKNFPNGRSSVVLDVSGYRRQEHILLISDGDSWKAARLLLE